MFLVLECWQFVVLLVSSCWSYLSAVLGLTCQQFLGLSCQQSAVSGFYLSGVLGLTGQQFCVLFVRVLGPTCHYFLALLVSSYRSYLSVVMGLTCQQQFKVLLVSSFWVLLVIEAFVIEVSWSNLALVFGCCHQFWSYLSAVLDLTSQ